MTSKQWLTIEDWLECTLPLCKLVVRHEGRPERCESDDAIRVCFSSSRVGGEALIDGESQVPNCLVQNKIIYPNLMLMLTLYI